MFLTLHYQNKHHKTSIFFNKNNQRQYEKNMLFFLSAVQLAVFRRLC